MFLAGTFELSGITKPLNNKCSQVKTLDSDND